MDKYEGYVRLLFALPVVVLGFLLVVRKYESACIDGFYGSGNNPEPYTALKKFESVAKPSSWTVRSTALYISDLQARLRQAITLLALYAGLLAVFVAYAYSVWKWSYWPELSLAPAENGYQVLALLVVMAVKVFGCILALMAFAIPFAIAGAIASLIVVYGVYHYLVYGSMLHVIFLFHWVMTGNYFAGIIAPSAAELVVALTVFNLFLSDIGDFLLVGVDLVISGLEKTG